ncbi:spore germination protein [Hydrogenispora ethanolica]|uniref:Spore germination protein n=1 Tax=Hydrogenispora ethanolica TaxID=1082276 RepID=A0A4R1QY96_HYDET|nr:GerAB/ArcD/ProY family transporter [Hydrogenispora ethanolica]TCL57874.1 spore germination protein [Hydrogenispora ethanolica]
MNHPLTSKLYLPLILMSILGFGIMFHPFTLNKNIGVNAYLTIVFGFLLAVLGLLAIRALLGKYPGESLIDWGNRLLGRAGWLGSGLVLAIVLVFTVLAVRRLTEPIGTSILFLTPEWANILSCVLVITYIAQLGEEALGRLCSICCGLIPVFGLNLLLGFGSVTLAQVHPAYIIRDLRYLNYWWAGLPGFVPVLLIASLIRTRDFRDRFRYVLPTVGLGALILGITAFEIVGVFGAGGIQRYPRPVMAFMGTIRLAQEYFFQNFVLTTHLFVFTAQSLVIATVLLRVLANGIIALCRIPRKRSRWVIPALAAVVYLLTLFSDLIVYARYNNPLIISGSFFILAYLGILWLLSRLRRDGRP